MKKIFALCTLLVLFSCSSAYQQIVSIASPEMKLTDDGRYTYDKDAFVIDYNFWADGGKVSFVLTNNSDHDVYVDLSRSFLVVNGMTFDYYQNRKWSSNATNTVTTSSSYGTSTTVSSALALAAGSAYSYGDYSLASGFGTASGKSRTNAWSGKSSVTNTVNRGVEVTEKEGVWVPAHASRRFNEFSLMDLPYRQCGFVRNPSKKEDVTLEFTEKNSPYTFENMIMLVVEGKDCRISNAFYIDSLTNIPYKESYEEYDEKDCSENPTGEKIRFYKFYSPNRFYINYSLGPKAEDFEMDRIKKGKDSNKASVKKEIQKQPSVDKKKSIKTYDDGLY